MMCIGSPGCLLGRRSVRFHYCALKRVRTVDFNRYRNERASPQSADPLEPNPVLAGDQKCVEGSLSPSLALDWRKSRIDDIGPPLRSRRAIWKQGSKLTLNLGEAELELVAPLAFEILSQGIVFSHECTED